MGKKRELKIYLGVQWLNQDTEQICRNTEIFLQDLNKINFTNKIPVHWVMPCYPYLEQKNKILDNLIKQIKSRIKSFKDTILSIGYMAAIQPILKIKELKNEIAWSIKNPWQSGIKDVFKITPEILISPYPDLLREQAYEIHSDQGFKLLGLPKNPLDGHPYIFKPKIKFKHNNIFSYIYFQKNINALLLKSIKEQIPLKDGYLFLLFNLSIFDKQNSLIPIINLLEKKFRISFHTIDCQEVLNIPHSESSEVQISTPIYCFNPITRGFWKRADILRNRKNQTSTCLKGILNILSSSDPLSIIEKNPSLIKQKTIDNAKRLFSSNMPGEVILPGNNFDANFNQGRLAGITKNDKQILCGLKAKSYIKTKLKKHYFETKSAFAFEEEKIRGLRELATLDIQEFDKPANMINDFFFVEDFHFLLINTRLDFPIPSNNQIVKKITPLEIPLFGLGDQEQIQICSIFNDNSKFDYTLTPAVESKLLPGSMFIINKNKTSVIIGFPPKKGLSIYYLDFTFNKIKKQQYLSVNPYIITESKQNELLSGISEICTLFLGIAEEIPEQFPHFPSTILKELRAYNVFKQS